MRSRRFIVLLTVVLAVVLLGGVGASDAISSSRPGDGTGAGDRATCAIDLRCAGQAVTPATGPLAQADSAVTVIGPALLVAGLVVFGSVVLRDRLAASRLFRPPRLAG